MDTLYTFWDNVSILSAIHTRMLDTHHLLGIVRDRLPCYSGFTRVAYVEARNLGVHDYRVPRLSHAETRKLGVHDFGGFPISTIPPGVRDFAADVGCPRSRPRVESMRHVCETHRVIVMKHMAYTNAMLPTACSKSSTGTGERKRVAPYERTQ